MTLSPKALRRACSARHPVQWAGMICLGGELLEVRHGVRDDPIQGLADQMQSAEDAVDRSVREDLASIEQDVDDSGVRTRTEDDQTLVAHADRQIALVHQ